MHMAGLNEDETEDPSEVSTALPFETVLYYMNDDDLEFLTETPHLYGKEREGVRRRSADEIIQQHKFDITRLRHPMSKSLRCLEQPMGMRVPIPP